ncbi:type-1 fimbrial protein, a chain [Edwardsiella tarda]|uniref:type-1 fimbrial protein, a chain n=1 Tax=Edwardsiella tarda TaxID=636 RepID=UPI000D507F7D|nr:type-1 fimbrial protein, a chain [Edwardsiella tarda]UCQ53555.1 type-1 fimbrial protein, a chain [Edwardsiella tarda]
MADQRNHRGWMGGIGAMALAVGLSGTAAWGAEPSSGDTSLLSGFAVPGGSGTINVTGHLINSSCAISVDKNSDEFTLSQAQVRTASFNDVLVTLPFTFTVSQCADTPLLFKLRVQPHGQNFVYSFGGENLSILQYRLILFAKTINSEQWRSVTREVVNSLNINTNGGVVIPNYDNQREGLLFTPASESEQFTINMVITRSPLDYTPTTDAENLSTTFTYEFVYN